MSLGKVYLVGAGPGAPDLLTLRAVDTIQKADILLYDRLINQDIMGWARASAQRIYVGKSKGQNSDARQMRIHALMVGHAREGKTVVRLKGGDPFVFGRGGEEVLHLAQAGVEVEVVPGVSSCVSAPASAMIPVTYRGLASSFAVFAGHPGDGLREIDWTAAGQVETAVFLMGVERLPLIASRLQELGRDPGTPVAVIEKAFHQDEKVITGTLSNIAERAGSIRPPATIVVGKVVSLRWALSKENARREAL